MNMNEEKISWDNYLDIYNNYNKYRDLWMSLSFEDLKKVEHHNIIIRIISYFLLNLRDEILKKDKDVEFKFPLPIFKTQYDIDLIWNSGYKRIEVNFNQYLDVDGYGYYKVKISHHSEKINFENIACENYFKTCPYPEEFVDEMLSLFKTIKIRKEKIEEEYEKLMDKYKDTFYNESKKDELIMAVSSIICDLDMTISSNNESNFKFLFQTYSKYEFFYPNIEIESYDKIRINWRCFNINLSIYFDRKEKKILAIYSYCGLVEYEYDINILSFVNSSLPVALLHDIYSISFVKSHEKVVDKILNSSSYTYKMICEEFKDQIISNYNNVKYKQILNKQSKDDELVILIELISSLFYVTLSNDLVFIYPHLSFEKDFVVAYWKDNFSSSLYDLRIYKKENIIYFVSTIAQKPVELTFDLDIYTTEDILKSVIREFSYIMCFSLLSLFDDQKSNLLKLAVSRIIDNRDNFF